MILATLPKRSDGWGSGEYGASRGNRKHNGIDYACYPDTAIYALVAGTITKLGYPYKDDLSYRYVQITDRSGFQHRYFYLSPMVRVGDTVRRTYLIGKAQNIVKRYSNTMKNHVHLEIKDPTGAFIDPEEFFK